jgi:hypothetical protein
MTTERDVAEWMFSSLTSAKYLEQGATVSQIRDIFGERFVYQNESGNSAINKKVLAEFKKLIDGKAAWDRSDKAWRPVNAGAE